MIQRTWWPRLNPNAQLAKGLVFAGMGGGASTLQFADASRYGNHGTLTNMDPATDWVFDPTLGRFALTGFSATEYVALPAGLTNLPASGDFAVSFFAKKSATALDKAAIAWDGTDDVVIYPHDLSAGDGIRVFWRNVTGAALNENGVTRTTGWNHYVFQSESATIHRVYADGVMVGSDGSNRSSAGPFSGVRIGNFADNTTQNYAGGYLSDVLFFSRALSTAEIQQLADPSNTMLSGLILPPRRMVWPAAVAGTRYGWNTIYTSRGRLIKAS